MALASEFEGATVRIEPALCGQRMMGLQRPTQIWFDLSDGLSDNVMASIGRGNTGTAAMLIGYARTSTMDQNAGLEAQERDLRAAGAERLYTEQVSSVAQRDRLAECLAYLREGDALVVTKPDRLARSTAELLTIEADLCRRGVGLLVLSMGGERLDTRNPTSKLMLTILAAVATWEREIMLERQREGIAAAKSKGLYKGRAPTVRRQGDAIRAALAAGESPTAVAARLGVARSSVYRVAAGG